MVREITIYGVGDVCPNRDDMDSIFENVADVIKNGDVAFCQLEPVLTERGAPAPQARLTCSTSPSAAGAIRRAGFDVVSFATNHCMDWGRDGFTDTLEALRSENLGLVGAGENIDIARRPVIRDIGGTRIAFLAYCSILPQNYWAQGKKLGCVPMRAYTVYEQIEHDQPGTPCRIHTYPHRDDMAAMIEDIRKAHEVADIVVVSAHWGIHFKEAEIAEYQRDYAYAAIDNGADIVLGHHAHILKPVEIYKGKAIFYSLGNFAMEEVTNMKRDIAALNEDMKQSESFKEMQKISSDWEKEKSERCFPADSYKSMIAKCIIRDKKISRVSFLPVAIPHDNSPVILNQQDAEFSEIVEYMKKINKIENIETGMSISGDEVILIQE